MDDNNDILVSLVEDDKEIRESLKVLIDGSSGFKECCSYSNAEEAIRELPKTQPDVVLMDINLPGASGIECIIKLKPKIPQSNFIILTMYEDANLVFKALQAGAVGYLLKRTPPARLLEAIKETLDGGSPMSLQIARMVVKSFSGGKIAHDVEENLTNRESEILKCLTRGMRYKEIADELFISVETVRSHLRKVYEKLQVRSAREAVIKYLTNV